VRAAATDVMASVGCHGLCGPHAEREEGSKRERERSECVCVKDSMEEEERTEGVLEWRIERERES